MPPPLAMLFGTDGPMEWIVIGLAVLLLFGSQRLPDTMRTLGRLSAKLYRARDEFRKEFQKALEPPDDSPSTPVGPAALTAHIESVSPPVPSTQAVAPIATANTASGGQRSEIGNQTSDIRPQTADFQPTTYHPSPPTSDFRLPTSEPATTGPTPPTERAG